MPPPMMSMSVVIVGIKFLLLLVVTLTNAFRIKQ